MALAEPFRGLDAVQLGHVQVDQDELRVEHVDQVERLAPRRRCPDNLEARRRRHQGAENVLEHFAVVDDEHAHGRLILGGHGATVPTSSSPPLGANASMA